MADCHSPASLLLVEDEAPIAIDLEARVKSLGYDVRGSAVSMEDALAFMARRQPDLVLMDILVKGKMDGINGADLIRKKWGVPVVFIIAYGDIDLLRRAWISHPFGYILKPFQDRELRITIEMALSAAKADLERQNTLNELFMEKERFRTILDNIPVMITFLDQHGDHQYVNRFWEERIGYSLEEARKGNMLETLYPDPDYRDYIKKSIATSEGRWGEYKTRTRAGRDIDTAWTNVSLADGSNVGIGLDITEKKAAEAVIRNGKRTLKESDRIKAKTIEILNHINAATSIKDLARVVTVTLRRMMGVEAVGLRLREGHDFPYYETRGFPEEFVEAERYLCSRDQGGQVLKDKTGHPVLECMCGHVISGRFNPSLPFFTEHGSFWSNDTTRLLRDTTETVRQGPTRNRCNGQGYETVVLIPLRTGNETFGLIQLNDTKKNYFSNQQISMVEGIADNIAIAIARHIAEEKTKAALKEKETLLQEIHHRVRNNMQVVISLIKLQSDQFSDPDLISAFEEAQNRIYAMAAIHGILHQSENVEKIHLGDYLEKLGQTIFNTYKIDYSQIDLKIDVIPAELGLERSYPIGLIFNELITNALKYAFPAPRSGAIRVISQPADAGWIRLIVSDNGIGIPDHLDWRNTDSLGLKLVQGLVEHQLGGRLALDQTQGTRWEMVFPINSQ